MKINIPKSIRNCFVLSSYNTSLVFNITIIYILYANKPNEYINVIISIINLHFFQLFEFVKSKK